MHVLQLQCDDQLIIALDDATQKLGWSRTEFVEKAVWDAINQIDIFLKELKHKQGYLNKPVEVGEFDVWEDEQEWGDV